MYQVNLDLDIAGTDVNIRSGVVTVLVEILSSDGTMLATSVRSITLVNYETTWVSTIRKGVLLAPLLIGAVDESRTVEVPSFRYLVENEDMPLRYATVTLLSQENKPIEVMTGSISIREELSPIQLFVKEWFFTCYAAGTAFLFWAQGIALFASIAISKRRKPVREAESSSLDLGSDVASHSDNQEERLDV